MLIKNYKIQKQRGTILIFALFFVVILSFLILRILESSSLENKIAKNYQDEIANFYALESKLIQYEQKVLNGENTKFATLINDKAVCGVTFYSITVTEKTGDASGQMTSTVAKFNDDIAKCDPLPVVTEGRQSWQYN